MKAFWSTAICAGIAAPLGGDHQRPATEPWAPVPVQASDLVAFPGLQAATDLYGARGGRYIWGDNDCSSFVSDYLTLSGTPLRHRLTTASLAAPDVWTHGLVSVNLLEPGDVLNYRYVSQKRDRMAGHCGVVVRRGGELWVVHNASSTGLVAQPLGGFYARAAELGVPGHQVQVLRRGW